MSRVADQGTDMRMSIPSRTRTKFITSVAGVAELNTKRDSNSAIRWSSDLGRWCSGLIVQLRRLRDFQRLPIPPLALLSILLVGCGTFIPPPPQIVSVPIGISCLPTTLPQRPKIATDAELSALDDYRFTLEIFIDRRRLLDYSGELEAVLGACR